MTNDHHATELLLSNEHVDDDIDTDGQTLPAAGAVGSDTESEVTFPSPLIPSLLSTIKYRRFWKGSLITFKDHIVIAKSLILAIPPQDNPARREVDGAPEI